VELTRIDVHEMTGEIEVRIVDPDWGTDAEREAPQPLAIARRPRHPPLDMRVELLEAGSPTIGRRREHRSPAYVHVGGRRFDREERRVKCR
jgi:hypothetical protein